MKCSSMLVKTLLKYDQARYLRCRILRYSQSKFIKSAEAICIYELVYSAHISRQRYFRAFSLGAKLVCDIAQIMAGFEIVCI